MTCKNRDIKEMLPAYLEQGLDEAERLRVERHLGTCEDCRTEFALLRLMSDERVPDPGEVFWAEMPGRVYRDYEREKRREKPGKKRPDGAGVWGWMILPRWAWAAAAAGIVLAVSWLAFHPGVPARKETAAALAPADEYLHEEPAGTGSADLIDLNLPEFESVAGWANEEFAAIGDEIAAAGYRTNAADTDIYDELAGLSSQEMERLSKMLEAWNKEG